MGKSKSNSIGADRGVQFDWKDEPAINGDAKGKEPYVSSLAKETSGASRSSVQKIENVTVDEDDSKSHVKPSRKKRAGNHFQRFCCCYCVAIFVLLAVGLPVLFLVIVPVIAQHMVDHADLPIHSVRIMDPKANSTVLSLTASLKVPPPFTVTLDPIVLQLYRPETKPDIIPFVNFALGEQHLKGNATVSVVNQTVEIANKPEFIKFLRNAVLNETFIMAARGETTARIGALKSHVKLDKQIRLNGLNNLDGFSINSASIIFPPEADGTNLNANLTLPDNSIVSFDLGNETLNINGPNNLILGNATIENVFIQPGNNTFTAKGIIDLKALLLNLESLISYEAAALAQGNLILGASGNSTVYEGVHIDYYEEILNEMHLTGTVPIIQLLANSFSSLLSGGTGGLKNLTSSLGVNLTQILGLLNGINDGKAVLPLDQVERRF